MNIFQYKIDKQLEYNKGKNLFSDGIVNSLKFTSDTVAAIKQVDKIDVVSESLLIENLTNRVLQEFCDINQYYSFNGRSKIALRDIYTELFSNIRDPRATVDSIEKKHYESLIKWLQKTNPFAEQIYKSRDELIESVPCSEYGAELQMEILQIDIRKINEPVLDIACGEKANLVVYLQQNGIESYGFDRFVIENSFLNNSDWFEYDYCKKKWGTIISHLGFSNHFIHNHLRGDGNYIEFAKQYMVILDSLKVGGSFHYAPDLPFIEKYLDENKFQVTRKNIGNLPFNSIKISRLR